MIELSEANAATAVPQTINPDDNSASEVTYRACLWAVGALLTAVAGSWIAGFLHGFVEALIQGARPQTDATTTERVVYQLVGVAAGSAFLLFAARCEAKKVGSGWPANFGLGRAQRYWPLLVILPLLSGWPALLQYS